MDRKIKIRTRKTFLEVGNRGYVRISPPPPPPPGFKERQMVSYGFSTEGALISASAVPLSATTTVVTNKLTPSV